MPQTVEFPNLGTVEFPDEFSPEEIQGRLPDIRRQLLEDRESQVQQQTLDQELAQHPNLTGRFFATAVAPQLANTPLGLSADELGSAAAGVGKGAGKAFASMAEYAGRAAETLPPEATMLGRFDYASPRAIQAVRRVAEVRAQETPEQRVERIEASPLVQAGKKVEETSSRFFQPNPALEQTFLLGDVPQGVGSLGAAMVASPFGPTAVFGATFGQEANDAWEQEIERQKREGEAPDPDKALAKSALYGSIATAIEAKLGVGRVYKRLAELFKRAPVEALKDALVNKTNPLWTAAKEVLKESAAGFSEESSQQAMEDWIVEGRANLKNALRAGAAGAIVQGPTALTTTIGQAMPRQSPVDRLSRELADVLNAQSLQKEFPTEIEARARTFFADPNARQVDTGPRSARAGPTVVEEQARPWSPPVEPTPNRGLLLTQGAQGPPVAQAPEPAATRPLTAPEPELKPITETDITNLADANSIPWDYDPAFMAWTKSLTGKEHLSELDAAQRKTVFDALQRGERPQRAWSSENLVPAIKWTISDGTEHINVGQRGQIHATVADTRTPLQVQESTDSDLGFVDTKTGRFVTKVELGMDAAQLRKALGISTQPTNTGTPPSPAASPAPTQGTGPTPASAPAPGKPGPAGEPSNEPSPAPAPRPATAAPLPPAATEPASQPTATPPAGAQAPGAVPPTTPNLTEAKLADIKARREELFKKLRGKIGQSSMGVDPEFATIAGQIAVNYVEEGVVRFADFVKRVKADAPELWDKLKAYLHGAWTTAGTLDERLDEVGRKDAAEAITAMEQPAEPQPGPPTAPRDLIQQYVDYRIAKEKKYHPRIPDAFWQKPYRNIVTDFAKGMGPEVLAGLMRATSISSDTPETNAITDVADIYEEIAKQFTEDPSGGYDAEVNEVFHAGWDGENANIYPREEFQSEKVRELANINSNFGSGVQLSKDDLRSDYSIMLLYEVAKAARNEQYDQENKSEAQEENPSPLSTPSPALPAPATALNEKQAQEEQEAKLIEESTAIARGPGTPVEKYRRLVALYNSTPRLTIRTAESKAQQAYSTPPPLAFLGGQLADLEHGRYILESTAGNGMLFIGAPSSAIPLANEINPERRARLEAFLRKHFIVVAPPTGLDANSPAFQALSERRNVNRLMLNPHFGSVLDESGQGTQFPIHGAITAKKTTPSVDLAIMLNSLNALTPDEKAVIIIGSKTGSMGATFGSPESRAHAYRRQEFLDLFKRYNVTDWFTVAGNLYSRMGAAWPVDVIVINGRRETPSADAGGTARPWVQPPRVYSTWESLEPLLTGQAQPRPEGQPPRRPGMGGGEGTPGGGGVPAGTGEEPGGPPALGGRLQRPGAPRPAGPAAPTKPTAPAGGSEVGSGGVPSGLPAGEQPTSGAPTVAGGLPGAEAGLGDAERAGASNAGAGFVEGRLNVPYVSLSQNQDPKLVVPTSLADAMRSAVLDLEKDTGQKVDDFVAGKMGWNRNQLFERLSAAQIEAVGLAIRNIERGSALVEGDMTGVGKGRVAAAIIEYARRIGKIPVFVTAKKALYNDMAGRDLPSIGVTDIVPFITDSKYEYTNPKGEEVTSNSSKKDDLRRIAETGKLPAGYNAVFTTYDQLKGDAPEGFKETAKEKRKRQKDRKGKPDGPRYAALRKLAPNSIFILDEAHVASGQASDLNIKLQDEILPQVSGSHLLTATFAKRADNLGLYAATTLMRRLGMKASALAELVQKGGNPLYQALSLMLAKSGEFVRREQSFEGVKIRFEQATPDPEREVENADTYTGFLTDLERLSRQVNAAASEMENDENQARPEEVSVNVEGLNFGARIYNLSQQYLLALRTGAVVNQALDILRTPMLDKDGKPVIGKNGKPQMRKPFISLFNTMAGPITDLQSMGLPLTFNGILLREMRKLLEVTVRDPLYKDPKDKNKDGKRKVTLTPEQLPDGGRFYRQLEKAVLSTDLSEFPISPIDAIKQGIEKAGFKVGEITGRGDTLTQDEEGELKLSKREQQDRNETLSNFNNGQTDAIIVNGASATGVSAHTDPKFKDQRQRVMVVAQPQPDVNAMMQMLGRIMRFGQVTVPEFIFLTSSLAAEKRFSTMLRGKLASLNANTSADTESEYTGTGAAEDIFNEIGDEVVYRVLESEPEIVERAKIPMPEAQPGETPDLNGFARKASGRFPLLPNDDAARLWKRIDETYRDEIRMLDERGENPLKVTPEDLKAKSLGTTEFTPGTGTTPFDSASNMEQVQVVLTSKPMTHEEATALADQNERKVRMAVNEWIKQSKIAEAERLETAEKRGVKPEQIDRYRKNFQEAREKVSSALTRIGQTFGFDATGNGEPQMFVVPIDIRLKSGDTADFSSPSKQELILATNTTRRTITVALSKTEGEEEYLAEAAVPWAETFNETSEQETKRHVITGNVLRGFQEAMNKRTGGARPRVAIFTREDGSVETGVIMPPGYTPGSHETGMARDRVENRTQFVRAIQSGSPIGAGPATIIKRMISLPATNDWRAVWSSREFRQAVPYAQQRGNNFVGELILDSATYANLFELVLRVADHWEYLNRSEHSLGSATEPARGVEPQAVEDLVTGLAPNAPVNVSNEEPPLSDGVPLKGRLEDDGSITIFAKGLNTVGEARAVLFEELGHLVARQPEYWALYNRLAALVTQDEINAMRAMGYREGVAVEEALMRKIVAAEQGRLNEPAFVRLWNDFKEWLTRFLREWGLVTNTDQDLREMVRAAFKVRPFPGEVREARATTATPVEEPETGVVGTPANQQFRNRTELTEQMNAAGLAPEQQQAYRDIGMAQSGLIHSAHVDEIKAWRSSSDVPQNLAAHDLRQVTEYADLRAAGHEDIALAPSADGFTVIRIPAGERSQAANAVLYTHENLRRLGNRLGNKAEDAGNELSKVWSAVQDAQKNGIPYAAASTIADDAIDAFNAQITAELQTADRTLTEERRQQLAKTAQGLQRIEEENGPAIRVALLNIAKNIPMGVLNGTQEVTDVGGVVSKGTPGAVGGVPGLARWIRAQTTAGTPVAAQNVVDWLTTSDDTGHLPLSYGAETMTRLGRLKAILEDEAGARQTIKDVREWFDENAGITTGKARVSAREFAQRYFKWRTSQKKAADLLRDISRSFRKLSDKVAGVELAQQKLGQIMADPQYKGALQAASDEVNSQTENTYRLLRDGRIYFPVGPLDPAYNPFFGPDEHRTVSFDPNPDKIADNVRNAAAIAHSIDRWLKEGNGDPSERRAWKDNLDWIQAQAMLSADLQNNYTSIPAVLDFRPFGWPSRIFLKLGLQGPPQGLKTLLPGIALNEFTRTANRAAQMATELGDLFRKPGVGWYALHNAIVDGAKSHNMGAAGVGEYLKGRQALSEDVYQHYIPEVLSEVIARNQSIGGIKLGKGDRLSNGSIVTEEDMAAVRVMQAYMTEFYRLLERNDKFIENKKEPLRIRDEATGVLRDILSMMSLIRMRRTPSRQGDTFAKAWEAARKEDNKNTQIADDGSVFTPTDARLALLNDNLRVLNDYWMTTNPEFVKSQSFRGDAITEAAHRNRAAQQASGRGTNAGVPNLLFDSVGDYLDWIAQEHVDAAPEGQPVSFAEERARAQQALASQFDSYTDHFIKQNEANQIENEANVEVRIAYLPGGPLDRPRRQMVAPDYFYNYAVATRADYAFLQAKALLPLLAQLSQKLGAIHNGLFDEAKRRKEEVRKEGGKSQRKYATSLRSLEIAQRFTGLELTALHSNLLKATQTVYDNDAVALIKRFEEQLSINLLAAPSPTINNVISALVGPTAINLMGGRYARALRFPLSVLNYQKRVLRFLFTGGQGKRLQKFYQQHQKTLAPMTRLLIKSLIEEEMKIAEYRDRAGIGTTQNFRERLRAVKENPTMFGQDFGPSNLTNSQKALNRLLSFLEGAVVPNWKIAGAAKGAPVPGLGGVRAWPQTVDATTVPTIGKDFDLQLDRMKEAMLEAMAKRADGTTETANWNDPNRALTPFEPKELGLGSFKELEWYRQFMRPAGSIEFLALRYYNAVKEAQQRNGTEDGPDDLKVPFAQPEDYNSMLREAIRSTGNPVDSLNRITRLSPTGIWSAIQQMALRFHGWSINFAQTWNRVLTLHSKDPLRKNAGFFVAFILALLVGILTVMFGHEEKSEIVKALTGKESSAPRMAGVQTPWDLAKYTVAAMAPTLMPYYGEAASRLMGASTGRSLLDVTAAIPAANIVASGADTITKMLQSHDPLLPFIDFLKRSFPVSQIPFHAAAQVSPLLKGEEESAAAAAAVRSSLPAGMEREGVGGKGGTLTPMSAYVRRAIDYAYAGQQDAAQAQIEKAVAYQIARGRSPKEAQRIVQQSIASRVPTKRVIGRLPVESEEAQLLSRMTGGQQAAYGAAQGALGTLNRISGGRAALVRGPKRTRGLGGVGGRSTRRRGFGRSTGRIRRGRSLLAAYGGRTRKRRRSIYA